MFSQISNMAGEVNRSFLPILVISLILLVLVTTCMIYFAFRYRKKKSPVATDVKEPLLLEITWTLIPTMLVLVMFYFGWKNYIPMRQSPDNAMVVKVTARMWSWQFEYGNGQKSSHLNVPQDKPVKLILSSDDVLHSLFIPAFKVKEDAVPGMETMLWFTSHNTGKFPIVCAEYCGHGHSSMDTFVEVLPESEFKKWYASTPEKEEAVSGLDLLNNNGCLDCHSLEKEIMVGPSFKGIYGRETVVITEGKERVVVADENYIRKSIEYPDADVVKGFDDVMPSFKGELSDKEFEVLIRYFKDLT